MRQPVYSGIIRFEISEPSATTSAQKKLKTFIALLLFMLSSIAYADDKTACLLKYYDEYTTNRVALFEEMQPIY
jgi:hypothetical protein